MTLKIFGPRLLVEISLPDALVQAMRQEGRDVPQPVIGPALIDTGASDTSIDEAAAAKLGLQIVNTIQVGTPAGEVAKHVHATKLAFPGTMLPVLPLLLVTGTTLANQGLVALIGRDFLMGKTLHYDGGLNVVTLSW